MTRKNGVILSVILSGLMVGCQLETPMDLGERCTGVTKVYLGNGEWCEGETCEFAKYIENGWCPRKAQYCITSGDDVEGTFCATECTVFNAFDPEDFNGATEPGAAQYYARYRESHPDKPSGDTEFHYCGVSDVDFCGGIGEGYDCNNRKGWKGVECGWNDEKNKPECQAQTCQPFYRLAGNECKYYANCCGWYCAQCAKGENTICSGTGDDATCVAREEGCKKRSMVLCDFEVEESENKLVTTGVCIDQTTNAFCGITTNEVDGRTECSIKNVCGANSYCDEGTCQVCPAGEENCGKKCGENEHEVDTEAECEADSPENCGFHGHDCLADHETWAEAQCVEAQCVVKSCEDGYVLNENQDECVPAASRCGSQNANCQEQSTEEEQSVCTGSTADDSCSTSCPDVDMIVCSGTCINPKVSRFYCGSAAPGEDGICERKRCRSDQECSNGVCVCPDELTDCDGACIKFDSITHCGSCENNCTEADGWLEGTCNYQSESPASSTCEVSACKDNYHKIDAAEGVPASCEADTVDNCGEHGHSCITEGVYKAECNAATCNVVSCQDGYVLKENACVLASGSCGDNSDNCLANDEEPLICAASGCVAECPEDYMIVCLNSCIDPTSSRFYCGTEAPADGEVCEFKPCRDDQVCKESTCVCPEGQTECDGTCVTLNTLEHCGSCTNHCADMNGWADGLCDYDAENVEESKCVVSACMTGTHIIEATAESEASCEDDSPERCGSVSNDCHEIDQNGDTFACNEGKCSVLTCITGYHQDDASGLCVEDAAEPTDPTDPEEGT